MSSDTNFAVFSYLTESMSSGSPPRAIPVSLALVGEAVEVQEPTNATTRADEIVINPANRRVMMIRQDSELVQLLHGAVLRKQGRSPASKSSVESMPRFVIGEDKEKGACSICLKEWLEGDVAAEMPCKHKFHSKCVEEWLGIQATCPLCRYKMPLEDLKVTIAVSFDLGERRSQEDGGR